MKMTQQQVLRIITREWQPQSTLAWSDLVKQFAKEMACISHKLDDDELEAFLEFGSTLFKKSYKEYMAGIDDQ